MTFPPQLPPLRVTGDTRTQYHSDMKRDRRDYSRGSSFAGGYGSRSASHLDKRPGFRREETSSSEEGYATYASDERSHDFPPAEFSVHHKFQFQSAVYLHGDSLKKKLDSIGMANNSSSLSLLTSSASELVRRGFYMLPVSIPSSASTTASSFGHRSPGGISLTGLSSTLCTSPYTTPVSLNTSRRTSIPNTTPMHTMTAFGASLRKLPKLQKTNRGKSQPLIICKCCPKNPRTFETAEELSAHTSRKYYQCTFCDKRFKHKSDAERHRNSRHVRRYSWSCSAVLTCQDVAFHESTTHPGEADICGYCGERFPRSGLLKRHGSINGGFLKKLATEEDLEERFRHLLEVHRFDKCPCKKFYRVDNFREHLNRKHAGASGKWTNMLENACLTDEVNKDTIQQLYAWLS